MADERTCVRLWIGSPGLQEIIHVLLLELSHPKGLPGFNIGLTNTISRRSLRRGTTRQAGKDNSNDK
jgi:hypothetical protein